MRFSDISKKESSLKYMSLFCSYLLISAMFLWGSGVGFVNADDEREFKDFSEKDGDKDLLEGVFDALGKGSDGSDIRLEGTETGFILRGGSLKEGIYLDEKHLDALSKDDSFPSITKDTWNEGKLTLKVGEQERTIDILNMPYAVNGVSLSKDGRIEYSLNYKKEYKSDDQSKIVISGKDDVTLSRPSAKDDPGIIFNGVKGKDGEPVSVKIYAAPWEEVDDNEKLTDRTIEYDEENGMSIKQTYRDEGDDSEPAYEYKITEPTEGMELRIYEDGKYALKDGKIEDVTNKLTVEAGDTSVMFGPPLTSGAEYDIEKEQYAGKTLHINEDGKISGDLSKIGKSTISITNNNDKALSVSKDLVGAKSDFLIDSKKMAKFSSSSNKGQPDITVPKDGTKSTTGATPNTKTVESPNLPTPDTIKTIKDGTRTGDPSTGTGAPGGVPPGGFPGGQGIPGGGCGPGGCGPGGAGGADGQTGLKKMLPWLLIIGGGALAAMLLFGGGDDEEDKSTDRRRGITNSSQDNKNSDVTTGKAATNPGQSSSNSGSGSEEESSSENSCVCDKKGCRDCPNDDCSQCFS